MLQFFFTANVNLYLVIKSRFSCLSLLIHISAQEYPKELFWSVFICLFPNPGN